MSSIPKWKKIPFLRWSFWRLIFGMKRLTTEWQVGDGRQTRLADHVLAQARKGDPADVIRVIDDFCYHQSYLTQQEGQTWRTTELRTHVEYQSVIKDLVLVSEYLTAS
jgi:catechol O-methyltransferase